MKFGIFDTPVGRTYGAQVDMSTMAPWDEATVAQVRDVILQGRVVGSDLSMWPVFHNHVAVDFMPRQREVERISQAAHDAVAAGRFIDFGYLPNEVIKAGGNRGGPLYTKGGIGHPFIDPWVAYHIWEQGACVYLFQLVEKDKPAGGVSEAVEFTPLRFQEKRLLLIGDRAVLQPSTEMPYKYGCSVAPSAFRFLPGAERVEGNDDPLAGAGANVLDPLMTMLLVLNTRNVDRQTITAPAKLNRARMKNRKPPIPPYDKVNAAPYVTAILARGKRRERSEDQGGTHASPIPHLRMGHFRQYKDHETFIMDTLVNVSDAARAEFKATRTHYVIR